MPTILLDTNAVSDIMRDHPQVLASVASCRDPITTSAIVVGEIQYGLDRLPTGKKKLDLTARAAAILGAIRLVAIADGIARAYGRLKAASEQQGLNADDNDLWIAATAIEQGSVLVTRDQIFSRISALQSIDWTV
ncbi:MAG TPA: type II toxin-antitoxin system VapC family toxin [Gemmataceae bacterium]|nr:type II toxin-antitoxin system VapC family toxin [Gemmataceae bacterium]